MLHVDEENFVTVKGPKGQLVKRNAQRYEITVEDSKVLLLQDLVMKRNIEHFMV